MKKTREILEQNGYEALDSQEKLNNFLKNIEDGGNSQNALYVLPPHVQKKVQGNSEKISFDVFMIPQKVEKVIHRYNGEYTRPFWLNVNKKGAFFSFSENGDVVPISHKKNPEKVNVYPENIYVPIEDFRQN